MNARELVACAEAAMMTAKAQGKDRVVVFEEAGAERPADDVQGRDVRSIAHLKMLQSLARKLNRLNDVSEIGEAIVDELRILVDYHNCCVYLLDGERARAGRRPREPRRTRPGRSVLAARRGPDRPRRRDRQGDARSERLRVGRLRPGHREPAGTSRSRPYRSATATA